MIARSLLLGLAAVSLAATAPAFAAGKPRNVSWGQIGVSFAAYNRDAQQCAAGTQGITLSLSPQTAHDLSVFGNGSLMGLFGIEGISPATALSPSHVRFYSSTYAETYSMRCAWILPISCKRFSISASPSAAIALSG
jgi:hypothetical protein